MPLYRGFRKVKITRYTSGSGTHTYDPGCTYAVRKARGGGGGGCGSGTGTTGGLGGAGGNSTIGGLTANGGGGGGRTSSGSATVGTGGTATGGDINVTGQDGQPCYAYSITYNSGGLGGGGYGAKFFYGERAGGAAQANSGSGGSGGTAGGVSVQMGCGGGEGAYCEGAIDNPGSESYAVGAAGTAGTTGTSGYAGGAGGSGCVEVYEYFD